MPAEHVVESRADAAVGAQGPVRTVFVPRLFVDASPSLSIVIANGNLGLRPGGQLVAGIAHLGWEEEVLPKVLLIRLARGEFNDGAEQAIAGICVEVGLAGLAS